MIYSSLLVPDSTLPQDQIETFCECFIFIYNFVPPFYRPLLLKPPPYPRCISTSCNILFFLSPIYLSYTSTVDLDENNILINVRVRLVATSVLTLT